MSNCKFPDSFMVCSQISARLRQVSNQNEFSPVAVSAAWHQAEREIEKMHPSLVAATKSAPTQQWKQPEEPVLPRKPKVTEHRETIFVFSDGSTASACTATGCSWGIRPDGKVRGKRHSGDGVPVASELDAAQEILDLLTPGESSDEIPTDRQELIVGPVERAPIAGDDSDFSEETETESETESESDELTQEEVDAETFDAD